MIQKEVFILDVETIVLLPIALPSIVTEKTRFMFHPPQRSYC